MVTGTTDMGFKQRRNLDPACRLLSGSWLTDLNDRVEAQSGLSSNMLVVLIVRHAQLFFFKMTPAVG